MNKVQHVYPKNDSKPHIFSEVCECEPEVTPEGLVMHRAFDERELWERSASAEKAQ